ncbi:MAG TPA: hypothetical protein VHU44_14600 [Acidobacteriaceae bacterium]|nr:hypothetical protein [Acidobacteriaceae bacterium]
MLKVLCVVAGVFMTSVTLAADAGRGFWLPSEADVATLERDLDVRLRVFDPLRRFDSYERHYAGITKSGVKLIEGKLLSTALFKPSSPGKIIEAEPYIFITSVLGGSPCDQIEVEYNPLTKTVTSFDCTWGKAT